MKKNSVGLLELETAVLECFLEKTPLSPLGVKPPLSDNWIAANIELWLSLKAIPISSIFSFTTRFL
jgi:hypothetical protein